MSPPAPDQVTVSLEALRGDARIWADQAGVLASAADQARALAFTSLEAGPFLAFIGTYTQLQTHVVTLCTEGRQAMTDIAGTLRQVADTYGREEAHHEHALRGLY